MTQRDMIKDIDKSWAMSPFAELLWPLLYIEITVSLILDEPAAMR